MSNRIITADFERTEVRGTLRRLGYVETSDNSWINAQRMRATIRMDRGLWIAVNLGVSR